MKVLCFVILGIFLCVSNSFGQQKYRDSLAHLIKEQEVNLNFDLRDSVYANSLNAFAQKLRFHNPDSLYIMADKSLKHSQKIGYNKGHIMALSYIGVYHSDQGNNDEALKNFIKASNLAKKKNAFKIRLSIQNKLANQYAFQLDYAKALKTYLEAIELATALNEIGTLSLLNENIALLYGEQNDFKESLKYFKRVEVLNDKIGDELIKAITSSNIAETHAKVGNYEAAMVELDKCTPIFEKHEMIDWLAFAFQVKGYIYLKQEKYHNALIWYNNSLSIHKKFINDDRAKIKVLTGIATSNMGLGKDTIAEQYARASMDIALKLKGDFGIQKSAELLYQIYKKRKKHAKALEYHELYTNQADIIAKNKSEKNLLMLKTKIEHVSQKKSLIEKNEKELAKQRRYVYASLVILCILAIVTLLVMRSRKIQKRLNIELELKKDTLEKSEFELKKINETKNKLFSIIGHDLRGPIGAFQGILLMLKKSEISQNEFMQVVPNLHADIESISFTLNNLLSWGQSQLKGNTTRPSIISLEQIVNDNFNLLSEIAIKKSIELISNLCDNTLAWSDPDHMDIIIRNLISNALKFTPENGLITINARADEKYWEVSVSDTGVGMDLKTQAAILSKDSTVTTYGTANEKGTGIGLSICKEMVEKNGGRIWVDSTIKIGTSFYFTVPIANNNLQQAV